MFCSKVFAGSTVVLIDSVSSAEPVASVEFVSRGMFSLFVTSAEALSLLDVASFSSAVFEAIPIGSAHFATWTLDGAVAPTMWSLVRKIFGGTKLMVFVSSFALARDFVVFCSKNTISFYVE